MVNDNVADLMFDNFPSQYRALILPELYPDVRPMRLENWTDDDREVYCGGEYIKNHGKRAESA
ncbi:hypothetical protein [Segniliparus rugosus]|uniref:Uncharacterized protein n=1 Tax=Segniliparus rugosus (strain ATCC BAA-974 / DSM 45345 / CCUG 50838 / CIP 108380 / JCM 13579 / CDC 945) TaxID=679197 RepID=E5XRX2_SEGRC|nr:hypothetical protein [Segniliparus rugosus]EFV12907.1 hypothetical protein HMPREF9336_02244 [Segniliparus rugosus ATCC BAA-974]